MPANNIDFGDDFEREMEDEYVYYNMQGAYFGHNIFNMEPEEMVYENARAFDDEVDEEFERMQQD